jgi:hypothetical protein
MRLSFLSKLSDLHAPPVQELDLLLSSPALSSSSVAACPEQADSNLWRRVLNEGKSKSRARRRFFWLTT